MQPTSHPPQEHQRDQLRLSRRGPRYEAYPGPYAHDYPGPNRPFPEPRRRRELPGHMPPEALAAGVLAVAGVLPLALLVGTSVALGGLWGDSGVEWWLYPLLLAPVVELWGAIQLLTRRSWWVPALTCLPGAVLFGYLAYEGVVGRDDGGLGWYTLALAGPLVAMVLAVSPSVRWWVAGRRRVVRGIG